MSEEQALDELDLLIQEYDPEQSDWRFRKSVMMKLIDRIRPATLRCSAESAASMRGALEKIATRKVIRYGDYLRCHTCGYKSVAPHTEERHAPNCARQLALAALSDPVLTEPQTAQEAWALLYLHDWDPPKEGQEHRWEPGKNVFPDIHAIYDTWQEAETIRAKMVNPSKYWVKRVHGRWVDGLSRATERSQAVNVNFIAPVGTCAICKKPPAADCAICASIALTRPE